MARRARDSKTSFTPSQVGNWLQSASPRDRLSCERIPGFHLRRGKGASGTWRLRYTAPDGKRRYWSIGRYPGMPVEDAAERASSAVDRIEKEGHDPNAENEARREAQRQARQDAAERSLAHYLIEYDRTHLSRRYSDTSRRQTLNTINAHFTHWMDRDMATLTKQDLRDWQKREERGERFGATLDKGRVIKSYKPVVAKPVAYRTLRRCLAELKTLLNHAVDDGVISENPLEGVKLMAPDKKQQIAQQAAEDAADRRMLTAAEVAGIESGLTLFQEELREKRRNSRAHGKAHLPDLDAAPYAHWFVPFCLLALHTGMRPGDIRTLQWGELSINFARVKKITEKSRAALRKDDKPITIEVPLNDSVLSVMRTWHRQQGKPKTGLVFSSERTGGPLSKDATRKPWARVRELGNLGDALDLYALRHNFISTLVANGTPLLEVAKLVGHSSTRMIEQHYGHLSPQSARVAVDIVAASLRLEKRGAESLA